MNTIVEDLILTSRLLNIFIGVPMFILGIVGNLLLMFIFTRSKFRYVSSVQYLLASTVTNSIQLLQTLLPRILSEGFAIALVKSNSSYCKVRNYIAAVVSLCSIFYLCWASFDQFISTSRNAHTRSSWTSKKFVIIAVFSTFIFLLIVHIPVIVFTEAIGESCTITNIFCIYVYAYGITPFTYTLFPMIIITYCSIGIVRNLKRSRFVGVIQMNKYLARQVRRMLIPQLIILIISGIPHSIQTVYSVATMSIEKHPIRIAVENVILNTVRLLFYLNYVGSFYIYVLMSSEIRHDFKKLFCQRTNILPRENPARVSNDVA